MTLNQIEDIINKKIKLPDKEIIALYNQFSLNQELNEENGKTIVKFIIQLSKPSQSKYLKHNNQQLLGKLLAQKLDTAIYAQRVISEDIITFILSDLTQYNLYTNQKSTPKTIYITENVIPIIIHNLNQQFTIDSLKKIEKKQPTLLQNLLIRIFQNISIDFKPEIAQQLSEMLLKYLSNQQIHDSTGVIRFKIKYAQYYTQAALQLLQDQLVSKQILIQSPEGANLAKQLLYIKHQQKVEIGEELETQLKTIPQIVSYIQQHNIKIQNIGEKAKEYEQFLEKIRQKSFNFSEIIDAQISVIIQESDDFQVKLVRALIESEQLNQISNLQYYIVQDSIAYCFLLLSLPKGIQYLKKADIKKIVSMFNDNSYNIFALNYDTLLSDKLDEESVAKNKQKASYFLNKQHIYIKFINQIDDKYVQLKNTLCNILLNQITSSEYYKSIIQNPSKLLMCLLHNIEKDKIINTYGLKLAQIPKNADLKTEQSIKKDNQIIQQRLNLFKQQEQNFTELFDCITTNYLDVITVVVNRNDKQSRITITSIIVNILCTRPFALINKMGQIKSIFKYLAGDDSVNGALYGTRQEFFQHLYSNLKKLLKQNDAEKNEYTFEKFNDDIQEELQMVIQIASQIQTQEKYCLSHCFLPWIFRTIDALKGIPQSNILSIYSQMAKAYQNFSSKQNSRKPNNIENTSILQYEEAKLLATICQQIPITALDFQQHEQILIYCLSITGTQTDQQIIEPLLQFVVSGNQQQQHLATDVLLHAPNIGQCITDDTMKIKVLFAEVIDPQLKHFFQLHAGRNTFMQNAGKHADFLLKQLYATFKKEIKMSKSDDVQPENSINIFYELIPKALFLLCEEANVNAIDIEQKNNDQETENSSIQSEQQVFNHSNSLIIHVLIHALTKIYELQVPIEDIRLDINTPNSRGRAVYWRIIESLSQFFLHFNDELPSFSSIGILAGPLTRQIQDQTQVEQMLADIKNGNTVNIQNYEGNINQQAEFSRRLALANKPISSRNYEVVNNYLTGFLKTLTPAFEKLPVFINPKKITLFQAILERYLQSTIFEQDQQVLAAAFNAIKSILTEIGNDFTNQVNYLLESGRKLSSDQIVIPQSIQLAATRLEQQFNELIKYGCVHWIVVKKEQLPYLVNEAIGYILQLRTYITTFVRWKDDLRINAFSMLERANMLQDKRLLDSGLNNSLGSVWGQLLTVGLNSTLIDEKEIKNESKSPEKYLHAQYKGYKTPHEFVLHNALPLWKQRLLQEDNQYHGACYNVAGLIITLGLSCLQYQDDLLTSIILPLLQDTIVKKQIEGLQLLLTLQINFKQLLEPYIPAVINQILVLDSSRDSKVSQLSRTFLINIMKYSSAYGIQCIASSVLKIFGEETDPTLLMSTVTFIYNVVSNKGKLSPLLFRHMLSKLVPKLLPGLQTAIHHTNGNIQTIVKDTLLKIVDQSTNPSIRKLGQNIVNAYIDQNVVRDVLIDLSDIQLQAGIDTAALLLVYPICERVLKANSSEFLQQANEKMPGIHTKTIAAHILGILTKHSTPTDFAEFAQQARTVLIQNLADNDTYVKSACAKNIVEVAKMSRMGTQIIHQELVIRLASKNLTVPYAYGLCEALTELSFDSQQEEILLYLINEAMIWNRYNSIQKLACKCDNCEKIVVIEVPDEFIKSNDVFFVTQNDNQIPNVQQDGSSIQPLISVCYNCGSQVKYIFKEQFKSIKLINLSPLLLYIPQKLINLDDANRTNYFISNNLVDAFRSLMSIIAVKELWSGNEEQLRSIARLLCTGFVTTGNASEIMAKELINGMRSPEITVRDTCLQLVGDLVSEIGSLSSEDVNVDNENGDEELQEMKKRIKSVKGVQSEQRDKVFIPESSLAFAAQKIGNDVFHRMTFMIYLLRYEQSDVRYHASNIWKLVTIQPVREINQILPLLFDECCVLLNEEKAGQRVFYQKLIRSAVEDITKIIPRKTLQEFSAQVKDKIIQGVSDEQKITSLHLYAAMVKADNSGIVSDQKIIEMLPQIVKGNSNPLVVSAASTLIASLNTGADGVLEDMIAPQLASLDQQSVQQVEQTAQSILAIADQRASLLLKITLQCISKPQLTEQIAILITHFIRLSVCLQDQLQEIIVHLIQRIQKDSKQVLLNAQSQKDITKVHQTLYVLNALLQEEFSNPHIEFMQSIIKNQLSFKNIEIQGPPSLIATLMIQHKTNKMIEERQTIGSQMQCLIDNLSNEQFSGICALSFSKIGQIAVNNINSQLLSIIVMYTHSTLQSIIRVYSSKLPCLLKIKMELLQLFQPMLIGLSNQANDEIQIQSLEIMTMFILATSNTKCIAEQTKETQQITYNDYQFTVPILSSGNQPLDILTQVLIGRLILVFKQKISDQQRLCMLEIISTIASFINVSSYEAQLSLEIQHYCLLHSNMKIQDNAINSLVKLLTVSKNKQNNIYNILKILFVPSSDGNTAIINENISSTLFCKILVMLKQMIKNTTLENVQINTKPGELQLNDINIYSSIIHLVWTYIMIVDGIQQEIIENGSKLIAQCLLKLFMMKQEEQFALQLIKCVFYKAEYLQTVCSQLKLLSDLFMISNQQFSEDIYKVIQYISSNLSKYLPDAEDKPFVTRLNQMLDVNTSRQYQELSELCNFVGVFLAVQFTGKWNDFYKEYQSLNVKITKKLYEWFSSPENVVKMSIINMLNNVYDVLEQKQELHQITFEQNQVISTQLGVVAFQYIAKALMDPDTAQVAQKCFIDFYQLKIGGQVLKNVCDIVKESHQELADEMEHRAGVLMKQIKRGML